MTSHVYITINLFNLCQQSYLPFNIYFFKCWHRLNEPLGGVGFNAVQVKKLSRYLKSYFMEITNKKSVYQHMYLISNFMKIIGYYKHIYFNINHYEIKIGYYNNIYFSF
jgi:hypothetical protein